MKQISKPTVWLIAALLLPLIAHAQIYSVVSDSYVTSVTPGVNFGNLGTLNVGGGATALIQIDLSRLVTLGSTARRSSRHRWSSS